MTQPTQPIPPFGLVPVPELEAGRDRDTLWRSGYRRAWVWWGGPPEFKRERVLSFPEWAIACPRKGCGADVGEPCQTARGLHKRRVDAHRAQVEARLGRPLAAAIAEQPWYRDAHIRLEQRKAALAVLRAAVNATEAALALREAKAYATAVNVDDAMIRRANATGHQRARRGRKQSQVEVYRQRRVDEVREWLR